MSHAPAAAAPVTGTPPFWRRALGHRSFVLGGALTLLLVLAAALSLVWTPWSPYEMNLPGKLATPNARTGARPAATPGAPI